MRSIGLLMLFPAVALLAVSLGCEDKTADPVNNPPDAAFTISPPEGPVETAFVFDASLTTDDNDPLENLSFRWDWESDGQWDTSWRSAPADTHMYSVAGSYIVTLNVMDSEDLVGEAVDTVNVKINEPPDAAFTISPSEGLVGTEFTFDASSTTDDYDPLANLSFRWDWENDGQWDTSWENTPLATHSYSQVGLYVVALQARDSRGLEGGATDTVSVKGAAEFVQDGWSYFESGDFSEAVTAFSQAIDLDSDRAEAYDGLGWSYMRLGMLESSIESFIFVLETLVDPSQDTYAGCSIVNLALGNYTDAANMANWALEVYGSQYEFQHDPDVTHVTLMLIRAIARFHLGLYASAYADALALGGPTLDLDAPDFVARLLEAIQELRDQYGQGLLDP